MRVSRTNVVIGAAVVVVLVLAWRRRQALAASASPLVQNAEAWVTGPGGGWAARQAAANARANARP